VVHDNLSTRQSALVKLVLLNSDGINVLSLARNTVTALSVDDH